MERFSEWLNEEKTEVSILHYKMRDAMIRLAAYEDTGLEPDEIRIYWENRGKESYMDYLFIFDEASKGWWLKIDSIEKLIDYHEKTGNGRYDKAMEIYLHEGHPYDILDKLSPEERIKKMQDKDFKRLQGAVMLAEKGERTILDGFRCLNLEVGMGQMRTLEQYGEIYINPVGGYTFGLQCTQFCRRKNLVFPNFKESDIRIKKFEGGEHYYAFIGDMQVRDGDKLKWYSREEAYSKARELIG